METNGHGSKLFEQEDLFEKLQETDGFHVVRTESGGIVQLYCMAYMGGELTNIVDTFHPENAAVEIASWENPTEAERGEIARLLLVLKGIARYLTTGGSWRQLEGAVHMMRKVAFGNLVFPGYHLSDSYECVSAVTDEVTRQHIFVKDDGSGKAVVWEEPWVNEAGGLAGGMIDRTTLEMLNKQSEEDEDEPGGEEEAGSEVEAEEAKPSLLQLPHRGEPSDS